MPIGEPTHSCVLQPQSDVQCCLRLHSRAASAGFSVPPVLQPGADAFPCLIDDTGSLSLSRPYFWSLFFGNLVGISAGILVITEALQMWTAFNYDHTKQKWNSKITGGCRALSRVGRLRMGTGCGGEWCVRGAVCDCVGQCVCVLVGGWAASDCVCVTVSVCVCGGQ